MRNCCFIICVLFLLSASNVSAQLKSSDYVRLSEDEKGRASSLDTAILRLEKGELKVDLVAAVHVADKDYYQKLNSEFKQYDKVLYELVAAAEQLVPPKESSSEISELQRGLKDMLEFDFQLDEIDYQARNFVHADLSPEALLKAIESRGESLWSVMFKLIMQSSELEEEQRISGLGLLIGMFTKPPSQRKYVLRAALARSMSQLDEVLPKLEGPALQAILSDRNSKALEVLERESGKGRGKFAIFYGGAHMPDIAQRLIAQGFRPAGSKWLVAWKLKE